MRGMKMRRSDPRWRRRWAKVLVKPMENDADDCYEDDEEEGEEAEEEDDDEEMMMRMMITRQRRLIWI